MAAVAAVVDDADEAREADDEAEEEAIVSAARWASLRFWWKAKSATNTRSAMDRAYKQKHMSQVRETCSNNGKDRYMF